MFISGSKAVCLYLGVKLLRNFAKHSGNMLFLECDIFPLCSIFFIWDKIGPDNTGPIRLKMICTTTQQVVFKVLLAFILVEK